MPTKYKTEKLSSPPPPHTHTSNSEVKYALRFIFSFPKFHKGLQKFYFINEVAG
jgi:hypothetical protein